MHFIAVTFLCILMTEKTNEELCRLKDLDVRANSSYVIYGVTDDGIFFNFSNDDVLTSGLSPDSLLFYHLNPLHQREEDETDVEDHRLEIIYTESGGMLHRILRRRYRFKNNADDQGVPRSTEFLYKGDRRSQINGSKTMVVFTVADTERMRYYVKHSDELGLNGGFPLWPFLCIFKIKGRKMFNMELRFKTIERPRGYRYADESRLWNTGADLRLNGGLENLGKEWQYAFATLKERKACILSKGIPYVDIHLLWRYNRRLRDVYRNTETSAPYPISRQAYPLNDPTFNGAVVVGVRQGVLFMCPTKENISTLDEVYNTAGLFAKNNPNFTKGKNWTDEGRVFLVSQHFKEVIVILAKAADVYYKAFRTSSDRLRAFTLRLHDFETIPKLSVRDEGEVLKAVDFHHDTLYLYYESETWKVSLSGVNMMEPIKMENSPRMITDTFTGLRIPARINGQTQLFNDKAIFVYEGGVLYGSIKHAVYLSTASYDALLVLKRTERVDPSITRSKRGFFFGIRNCAIFVDFNPDMDPNSIWTGYGNCSKGKDIRMFFAHSHIIVVSYVASENALHYFTKKVEIDASETWTELLREEEFKSDGREFRPEIRSNSDLCYVRGYKLYCVLDIKKSDKHECNITVGVVNWLTNDMEPWLNFPIYKFYGGNWKLLFKEKASISSYSNLCEKRPDFLFLKDGKDLLMRLANSNVYLCQNEHLPNNFEIPCFNASMEEWEKPRLISWAGPLIAWMINDPPEFLICEAETSRAELFEKYSNAPEYDDEPPPAEEIRLPKGDELKKSDDLWDMQCPAWQRTATLILCVIEAFELFAFCVVLFAVQFIAKPQLRKYRIQKGVGITRKKREMKKRALKRLRKLRLRRIRRRRRLARRQAAEIVCPNCSHSSGSSSSSTNSEVHGCKSENVETDLRSFTTQTRGENAPESCQMRQAKDEDSMQELDLKHDDPSFKSVYLNPSSQIKG